MQPNAANAVNAGENDGTLTANSELMTSREFRKGSSHRHCFGFRHSHLSLSRYGCAIVILHEAFSSVRGYGLRAYEPRQGRNAATVV